MAFENKSGLQLGPLETIVNVQWPGRVLTIEFNSLFRSQFGFNEWKGAFFKAPGLEDGPLTEQIGFVHPPPKVLTGKEIKEHGPQWAYAIQTAYKEEVFGTSGPITVIDLGEYYKQCYTFDFNTNEITGITPVIFEAFDGLSQTVPFLIDFRNDGEGIGLGELGGLNVFPANLFGVTDTFPGTFCFPVFHQEFLTHTESIPTYTQKTSKTRQVIFVNMSGLRSSLSPGAKEFKLFFNAEGTVSGNDFLRWALQVSTWKNAKEFPIKSGFGFSDSPTETDKDGGFDTEHIKANLESRDGGSSHIVEETITPPATIEVIVNLKTLKVTATRSSGADPL